MSMIPNFFICVKQYPEEAHTNNLFDVCHINQMTNFNKVSPKKLITSSTCHLLQY
jgi:hypothetical protein